MAKTVVGLFDTFGEAQSVVQDLMDNGFRREDISVVANENATGRERMVGDTHENAAAEGAGAGAVGGTVLGGALGLLVGAGLLAIPGIGPVLAAGPLAAAIGTTTAAVGATALGAGIGAATGGLIGGLVGAGVPKEDAEYYAEGVRRGGTLVSVNTEDATAGMAHDIMSRHNVIDIDDRATQWRSSGWTGFDASTEPLDRSGMGSGRDPMVHSDVVRERGEEPFVNKRARVVEEIGVDSAARDRTDTVRDSVRRTDVDMQPTGTMGSGMGGVSATGAMQDFDAYDNDYRGHYQQTYGAAGYTYDDYAPVYRYGHSLATDSRYRDRDWSDIEMDARRRWEEHNPGTWEQFKDTVRFAWDKVRGRR